MPDSAHMQVTISTSATPEQVFATLIRFTSALPSSTRDFQQIGGPPTVSIDRPQFSVRVARLGRGDVPVEWNGEVSATPHGGALIVARTSRSWIRGPFAVLCLFSIFMLMPYFHGVPYSGVSPLFVATVIVAVAVTVARHQATHLRDRDKKNALELLEIILERLPESSVVERSTVGATMPAPSENSSAK